MANARKLSPAQSGFLTDDYGLSFRDGPKDQTRHLEVLRCAIAHHSSLASLAPRNDLNVAAQQRCDLFHHEY